MLETNIMTDIQQTQLSATTFERALAEQNQKSSQASMIYHVLPSVVQSRIPTLPSIRRSLSDIRGRGLNTKSATVSEAGTPESPPPSYSSTPGHVTPHQAPELDEFDYSDDVSERPLSSSMTIPPPFATNETKTGINWKYANQGFSLVAQACRESSEPKRDVDKTSISLTRQLYMHGMTYLLRGIPADLTPEETLSLRAALPQNLNDLQNEHTPRALVPVSRNTTVSHERQTSDVSILHRITATIVFQTFVLIQFLLPYIKLLIGHAYRFERDHRVAQRFVNKSIVTIDEIGRRGIQLSQTVCQMNDGKVGQAVNEIAFYWVQGLTGGFQQGMTEGVSMISERPYEPRDDWRR